MAVGDRTGNNRVWAAVVECLWDSVKGTGSGQWIATEGLQHWSDMVRLVLFEISPVLQPTERSEMGAPIRVL